MLCDNCLNYFINKLHPSDLVILEYLNNKEAYTPQFSISTKFIQKDTELSIHHTQNALLRLETLGMIDQARGHRSNKYFITKCGRKALSFIQLKIEDISKEVY